MKTTELKELTNDELYTRRRDLKHEVLNLRVQQESGQLENPARMRVVRREVARIETILSERRLQEQAPAGATEAAAASSPAAATTE
ncbi:MAG: 50S ribosomal protein L29 [Verrucomicrobiota bacterium]